MGDCSVGIVRSRIQAKEFTFSFQFLVTHQMFKIGYALKNGKPVFVSAIKKPACAAGSQLGPLVTNYIIHFI
jgi:hypothetical protein